MGKDVIKIANEMGIVVDDCSQMLHALRNIRATACAPGQHGLMLTGEVGTGKSTMAKLFHRCSPVHGGNEPFFPKDCAAFVESLADSELFGHEEGAYTGAGKGRKGLLETVMGGDSFSR